jgi:hypothetical protein
MTDPLTLVRAADPTRDLELDPAAAERIDDAFARLLASEPAPAARPARSFSLPRPRGLGVALATAVACGAALFVALPGGGGSSSSGIQTADAATVLRAARAAALVPAGTGAWTTMTVRDWRGVPYTRADGSTALARVPYTTESWIADDGEQIRRSTRGSDVLLAEPADRAAWDADRRARQPSNPADGKLVRLPRDAGEPWSLPTDPSALATELAAMSFGTGVHYAASLLLSPQTTPEQRAALYSALLRIPGARLQQGVTDPEGRTGDAVRFVRVDDTPGTDHPNGTYEVTLLFDHASHALLGVQQAGDQPQMAGGTAPSWSVVLDLRRTDQAPKPQLLRTLPHGNKGPKLVPAPTA